MNAYITIIHRARFHCTTAASELYTPYEPRLRPLQSQRRQIADILLVQPACKPPERFVYCGKIRPRDRGDRRVTLEKRVFSRKGQLQTYDLQEACGYMGGDAYFHFQCPSVSLAPQKRCALLVHYSASDRCGILTLPSSGRLRSQCSTLGPGQSSMAYHS